MSYFKGIFRSVSNYSSGSISNFSRKGTCVVDFLLDETSFVAIHIACRNVGKDVEVIEAGRKFMHRKSALDIGGDGVVEPCVEIDAGCTVYDDAAILDQLLVVFGRKADVFLRKVPASEMISK